MSSDWKDKVRWDSVSKSMVPRETLNELNPDKAKKKAKELWKEGHKFKEIEERTGLNANTVSNWANRTKDSWKKEQDAIKTEATERVVRKKTEVISEALDIALEHITNGLADLRDRGVTLTLSQIRTATTIAKDLYYMNQLAMGQPTEIHGKAEAIALDEVWKTLKEVDPNVDWDEKLNGGGTTFN